MHLTKREIAATLAGLRLLQLHPEKSVSAIATNCGEFEPLAALEIDALCEKLNFDDAPPVHLLTEAIAALLDDVSKLDDDAREAFGGPADASVVQAVAALKHFSK